MARGTRLRAAALASAVAMMAMGGGACSRSGPASYQGYVEGEFVHVGSGVAGRLDRLLVERGQTVEGGAALFQLESTSEAAAVRQADETLLATKAQLADLGTGKRTTEIDVTLAQLDQAAAAEKQSATELERDTAQFEAGGISRAKLDASRAKHDVDAARVRELRSQLKVAEEAARPEQIRAQSAQVAAAHAALDQTRWRLDEKNIVAKQGGLVVDTLFRVGEWVPAGQPVVRLLPPAHVKVRFFVPEAALAGFPVGGKVSVDCGGCGNPVAATVSYVSTEPEFTPPVIYSNETRSKLVFMVEARPAAEGAPKLRPGQPVAVALP